MFLKYVSFLKLHRAFGTGELDRVRVSSMGFKFGPGLVCLIWARFAFVWFLRFMFFLVTNQKLPFGEALGANNAIEAGIFVAVNHFLML